MHIIYMERRGITVNMQKCLLGSCMAHYTLVTVS